MLKEYKLLPLINLDRDTQLQILKIRNEPYIREWMFTGNIITEHDHFTWIDNLGNDEKQLYLVIMNNENMPFGSVNVKNIDKNNKIAELGFYKTQSYEEKGLMTASLSALIDYSFNIIGLEKIYSEVFEGNIKSMNIHKKLLFSEEGFMRSHIIKNGLRIGVYLFGLLKDEWQDGRKELVESTMQITPPPIDL